MDVSASAYMSAAHALMKAGTTAGVYSIAEILKDFDIRLITFQAGMPWTLSRTVGLQPSLLMWAQSKLTPSEHSGRASQIRCVSFSRQASCTQARVCNESVPRFGAWRTLGQQRCSDRSCSEGSDFFWSPMPSLIEALLLDMPN